MVCDANGSLCFKQEAGGILAATDTALAEHAGLTLSHDNSMLASISRDKTVKVKKYTSFCPSTELHSLNMLYMLQELLIFCLPDMFVVLRRTVDLQHNC